MTDGERDMYNERICKKLNGFLNDCREVAGCGKLAFNYDDMADSYYLTNDGIPDGWSLVEVDDGPFQGRFQIYTFDVELAGPFVMLRLAFERLLGLWFQDKISRSLENAFLDRIAAEAMRAGSDDNTSRPCAMECGQLRATGDIYCADCRSGMCRQEDIG